MAKPRQQFLTQEMEPQRIQEVEDEAENLHDIRTRRIALNQEEETAQALLIGVMEKHSLSVYKFDKMIVTIEPGKTKAKVKEVDAEDKNKEED